jgi:hypothetical protein
MFNTEFTSSEIIKLNISPVGDRIDLDEETWRKWENETEWYVLSQTPIGGPYSILLRGNHDNYGDVRWYEEY